MTICVCDFDPPEFYSQSKPQARKEHWCEECGAPIMPGERYERVTGKWDGCVGVFKTCERCHDLRQWVKNNVPCFCWAHGNMLEDARDTIQNATWRAGDEVAGLRFGFLRRLYAVKRRMTLLPRPEHGERSASWLRRKARITYPAS